MKYLIKDVENDANYFIQTVPDVIVEIDRTTVLFPEKSLNNTVVAV